MGSALGCSPGFDRFTASWRSSTAGCRAGGISGLHSLMLVTEVARKDSPVGVARLMDVLSDKVCVEASSMRSFR